MKSYNLAQTFQATASGWKIFCRQPFTYLKFSFLQWLTFALGVGLFMAYLIQLPLWSSLPRTWGSARLVHDDVWQFAPACDVLSLLSALVFLLVVLLVYYLYKGSLYVQLRFHRAAEELPRCTAFTFSHELRRAALRAAKVDAAIGLPMLLVSYLFLWSAFRLHPLMLLVWLPLYAWWDSLASLVRQYHGVWQMPLKQALQKAWREGNRRIHILFAMRSLSALPYAFIVLVAFTPTFYFPPAYQADYVAQLYGNASGIPPYVSLLFGGACAVGTLFATWAMSLRLWGLTEITQPTDDCHNHQP